MSPAEEWLSAAAWPTPNDPDQWAAAGAAAAIMTAPVTAAAVLVGWFCSAVTIGDGFRCRADLAGRADVRFCFRCLADLLDKAEPSVGRSGCAL